MDPRPERHHLGRSDHVPQLARLSLTGLTRGKDIWLRVRAGPWSDPATIMVT